MQDILHRLFAPLGTEKTKYKYNRGQEVEKCPYPKHFAHFCGSKRPDEKLRAEPKY